LTSHRIRNNSPKIEEKKTFRGKEGEEPFRRGTEEDPSPGGTEEERSCDQKNNRGHVTMRKTTSVSSSWRTDCVLIVPKATTDEGKRFLCPLTSTCCRII